MGRARALVAGVAVLHDQVNQCLAAQLKGQLPHRRLVAPHQWGADAQAPLQPQVQRQLHGLHGVVAAIGVAGKIGLTHPGHQHLQPPAVGQRPGQGHEQQVAPRHKGVGQAILLHGDGHILGQRRAANLPDHIHIQHMVWAQAGRPMGELPAQALQHRLAGLQLYAVALAVVKTQGFNVGVVGQGVGQAGGRVLPAGK